jgi:hypothetical protein
MPRLFWNGPTMRLVAVTKAKGMWCIEFHNRDDHSRYSYYPIDKFVDELAIFKWWQEQTS